MPSPACGKEQPFATKHAGTAWLESCFAKMALRVLAESELRMSQQGNLGTEKVSSVLGFIKSSIAKKLRRVVVCPYFALTWLRSAPWVLFEPSVQERLFFSRDQVQ